MPTAQRYCLVCDAPLPEFDRKPGRPVVTCSPEHRAERAHALRRLRYRKRVLHDANILHRALRWNDDDARLIDSLPTRRN